MTEEITVEPQAAPQRVPPDRLRFSEFRFFLGARAQIVARENRNHRPSHRPNWKFCPAEIS